tara:strand:+ start:1506 stop:1799 length:294 start_codon:yes stop_codon:yes gene_type:complete
MYFISTIVLSVLFVIISIVLFYALKRINQYEELFLQISDTVTFIQMTIDTIDKKGTYKSDDEVGFFWNEVVKLSGMLSSLFESVYEEGELKDAQEEK